MDKFILTPEEAAKILEVGVDKLYELLKTGEIPSKKIDNKYLIPRIALDQWLLECILERDKNGRFE